MAGRCKRSQMTSIEYQRRLFGYLIDAILKFRKVKVDSVFQRVVGSYFRRFWSGWSFTFGGLKFWFVWSLNFRGEGVFNVFSWFGRTGIPAVLGAPSQIFLCCRECFERVAAQLPALASVWFQIRALRSSYAQLNAWCFPLSERVCFDWFWSQLYT